jgi:hypothetical protein
VNVLDYQITRNDRIENCDDCLIRLGSFKVRILEDYNDTGRGADCQLWNEIALCDSCLHTFRNELKSGEQIDKLRLFSKQLEVMKAVV